MNMTFLLGQLLGVNLIMYETHLRKTMIESNLNWVSNNCLRMRMRMRKLKALFGFIPWNIESGVSIATKDSTAHTRFLRKPYTHITHATLCFVVLLSLCAIHNVEAKECYELSAMEGLLDQCDSSLRQMDKALEKREKERRELERVFRYLFGLMEGYENASRLPERARLWGEGLINKALEMERR